MTVDPETIRARLNDFVRDLPPVDGPAEGLAMRCLLIELYLQFETSTLRPSERLAVRRRTQRLWSGDRRLPMTAHLFKDACEALLDALVAEESDVPLHMQARRFIDRHWADSISLTSVARSLHVHPRTLRRHFHQAFGLSIRDYRQQIRGLRGVELLQRTDLKIEAIAAMVGYRDRSSFCHLIERTTGKRPGQLRSRNS
jgi:AraC-like DNA-binding protein